MEQVVERGPTLAKALEMAESCEKVNTQLAAMTPGGKGEASTSVNHIQGTKRGSDKKNQSRGTKNGWKSQAFHLRSKLSSKRSLLS